MNTKYPVLKLLILLLVIIFGVIGLNGPSEEARVTASLLCVIFGISLVWVVIRS